MQQVALMDFFMPCWNSAMPTFDAWKLCKRRAQTLLRVLLVSMTFGIGLALADNPVQLEAKFQALLAGDIDH